MCPIHHTNYVLLLCAGNIIAKLLSEQGAAPRGPSGCARPERSRTGS